MGGVFLSIQGPAPTPPIFTYSNESLPVPADSQACPMTLAIVSINRKDDVAPGS